MEKLSYKELQKLFIEAKNGNNDSFETLYNSTYRAQYFIAYNYINNQHLAEEAVHRMYISFYKHLNSIENDLAIIQWMNIATINECKKLIKKEKLNDKVDIENYEDKLVDTSSNPEETFKQNSEIEILNAALDKLEPKLKEIVIYKYVDNLKIKEISQLTNLSAATIHRHINVATEKLKKYINNINNKAHVILFNPFIFKLVQDVMHKQVSDRHIVDSYAKFAGDVATAGLATATSATGIKVATSAAKKGLSASTKAAIGSGTAIAAATAVVAIAITPNYEIKMLKDDYVLSQVVSVSSNNIDQIDNISCYKEDRLVGELTENNGYSIEIEENGEYTIAIKDIVGKTQKENIEINNIDYESPLADVVNHNGYYEVYLSDAMSGVNYNKITITNQDGNNVSYSLKDNAVIFTNANSLTRLTVYDNLGNNRTLIISAD